MKSYIMINAYIIMFSICSKVLNANNNIMKAKSNRKKGENSNAEK